MGKPHLFATRNRAWPGLSSFEFSSSTLTIASCCSMGGGGSTATETISSPTPQKPTSVAIDSLRVGEEDDDAEPPFSIPIPSSEIDSTTAVASGRQVPSPSLAAPARGKGKGRYAEPSSARTRWCEKKRRKVSSR